MNQGLRELTNQELNAALESVLLPRLSRLLSARDLGHCMRVTDLDRELMIRLAGGLRAAVPSANVVVLADDSIRSLAPDLSVSSTKLVELRNPLPNDEIRPPLLVFVPNDLRAAAEDSFGVATFEEVAIDGAYAELNAQLIAQVPANLRVAVDASLSELGRRDPRWRYADDAAVARYLLTCQINEFDPDAMGAALFELALVPDFELFQQAERAPARVARNRECVERITWSTKTERLRALELGLLDALFCRQLGEFFSRVGVANPREWTRAIVRDRVNWPLAFNRWLFEDGGVNPDAIYIGDVVLPDLPVVKDDNDDPRLAELIGHKVLPISKTGLKKFSVSFRVDPIPSKVEGLSRFVAEVVSRDSGPTGLRRRKAAWAKGTDSGSIAFSSIGKIDWEEGWHYVSVYAETEDGDRIPLVDGEGHPVRFNSDTSETRASPNESDLFYVVTDDEVEVEPPQRAVPREASLMHALLRARFAAVAQDRDPSSVSVTGCGWVERSTKATTTGEVLEIRLGKEGKANVLVSGLLANLERAFLGDPDGLNRLRLSVSASGVATRSTTSFKWPVTDEVARFREARAAFFVAVLKGDQRLIMQASDLLHLQEPAQNYAAAYLAWIDAVLARSSSTDATVVRQAMDELRCALTIDSVALVLEDYQGRRRDAVLLGPTHPLRANWHVAWGRLGQIWMEQSRLSGKEFVVPTRDAVIKQLAPAAFPPVVPFGEELGRTALAVDNVNPFWSLYAATDEKDPRGLIGEVCAALGLPEPAIGGATIDSTYLAARVRRYLVQHPYVETLTINVFNAGRAGALADVLLVLQRHPEFADLRYDIRLFVLDPAAPSTGEALLELLSPDSGTSAKEADAFSTPTDSHLHPKLRLAIRAIKEFRDAPDLHAAHLSFLFDLFPAEEIRAVDVHDGDDSSFVHGLIQPFEVDYLEDEQSITWLRRPLHGVAQPLEAAEALSDLIGSISRAVSVAVATVARSQYLPHARPVVALSLSADERAMLHQVHEVSDWVLTIDRNLGIEFFDHRRHSTRPDYLIDHSPDMANAMGHRLAITSRSVTELESLLVPILGEYGLPNTGRHALVMLDQLRSLSGRLALKLLSSSSQRAEAMGLALSRLFLEHQGVFQNQIVVPLDAHLELYKALRQTAEEMGDDVSFRRTDLALFDLDPSRREVTCRLVEVKCYSQVGDVAAYTQLKESISEQIAQTEEVLAYHFDPKRAGVDRSDRPIKNRDLAALLGFYLDRSERYGVVLPEAAKEARYFLRRLDEHAYTLQFTRSAVVFDFSKPGTEPAEHENGIEFYRIGSNLIRQLVESAVPDTETIASVQFMRSADTAREVTQELLRRRELAPAVPTFETAAFLSQPRDRTLAWDESQRFTYPRPEASPSVEAREPVPAWKVTPQSIAEAPLPIVAAKPTLSSTDEPAPVPVSTPVPVSAQAEEEVEFEGSCACSVAI
ncbi:hypothetical protein KDX27_42245 [Burkholderia cenocepacia]|uniref:methylation-associated defense system ATP-binding protein MAD8 n=1 Tax=Burkholderia cenocepacia TaxID=95486 RepID=UPI001B9250E7|nr:hypothetical protein [Burkholderia cenocepacia]MBR8174284.1 hypothetical protein [Burkholderia cenocepacia]